MEEARHLNITANRDNPDEDIQKIIKEVRPSWNKEHVEVKALAGGFVNKTFSVVHDNDLDDGLVIRINGQVGENAGISREEELKNIKLLNANNLGVPLLASFENGLVSKLAQGKSLTDPILVEKMVDENFVRKLTRTIAAIHTLSPQTTKPVTKEDCPIYRIAAKTLSFARKMKNHPSIKKFNDSVPLDELQKEIDSCWSELEKLQIPICFSHNDVWHSNILYDEKTDTLNLIDYEAVGFNFAPYDLAKYSILLMRPHIVPTLPIPKNIPKDFLTLLSRCYLEAKAELENKPTSSVTEDNVQQVCSWTQMCFVMFLLFGTPALLALLSEETEGEERKDGEEFPIAQFDPVDAAIAWYQEYKVLKEEQHLGQ